MLLEGAIAAITGAASKNGIGLATARKMAGHGARIAILDLDAGAASAAAESIGDGHIGLACDVTDRDQCRAAADAVVGHFGKVDILVNNAGITQPLRLMDISPADWARVHDVNLTGIFNCSQAFVPAMRAQKSGAIICLSSVSAQRGGGIFGGPHYSSSKAGVLGFAKAMARELGADNIRVNCVTPGLIQTDITAGKLSDAMRTDIKKGIPLGRLGEADDVAGVCVFLASPLSAYVTGAVIDVNGGMLIHG